MKFVPAVIIAADVAVVIYVEKLLVAGKITDAGHVVPAHPKELLIFGLVFALPALVLILASWLRGRRAPAPSAPASRPGYGSSFRGGL